MFRSYEHPMNIEAISSPATVLLHSLILSQALDHEWIGLEEIEDGVWSVLFCDVLLARLDEREMALFS